jgi:hypothetical protein
LLGNRELTNILVLVGGFTTDAYLDQEKLKELCSSLLMTLADEKAFINPKLEDAE